MAAGCFLIILSPQFLPRTTCWNLSYPSTRHPHPPVRPAGRDGWHGWDGGRGLSSRCCIVLAQGVHLACRRCAPDHGNISGRQHTTAHGESRGRISPPPSAASASAASAGRCRCHWSGASPCPNPPTCPGPAGCGRREPKAALLDNSPTSQSMIDDPSARLGEGPSPCRDGTPNLARRAGRSPGREMRAANSPLGPSQLTTRPLSCKRCSAHAVSEDCRRA